MTTSTASLTVRDVIHDLFDGPHATPPPSESGPVFLGINNISEDGRLDLTDVRHINEKDFGKWTKRVTPQAGDIVFSYEATLNRYAIIPREFRGCLGRRLALLRLDEAKVNGRFLHFYFFSPEWRHTISANIIAGATVNRIPLIRFPDFPVRLPPLPVQRRIADILSAYDDLIENNTKRIKILEEMARSLYREWFVNFRFPGHEKVKMVSSALGKVPEGWEVVDLGTLAAEVRDSVNPTMLPPDTPYFGLEHLPRRSLGLGEWGIAGNVTSTKLRVKKMDVLFGKIRPYFHKVGPAPLDAVCSSDVIVLRASDPRNYGLVLAIASSDDFVAHATRTSQGTGMPRANWDVLRRHLLSVPPPKLLGQFSSLVTEQVRLIHALVFSSRNLAATRDLLLPRLISGEVSV